MIPYNLIQFDVSSLILFDKFLSQHDEFYLIFYYIDRYNENLWENTMRWAMIDILEKPPKGTVFVSHFAFHIICSFIRLFYFLFHSCFMILFFSCYFIHMFFLFFHFHFSFSFFIFIFHFYFFLRL